jgi:hypothetical protein
VWRLVRVKPKQPSRIRALYDEDEEVEAGSGWQTHFWSGTTLQYKPAMTRMTNFGYKGVHRVENAFFDDAGNEYISGDMVIGGYRYERYSRPRSHSYFLQDDRAIVYVYTYIVMVSKFSMPPTLGRLNGRFASYELTTPVMEIILDAIGQCEALD